MLPDTPTLILEFWPYGMLRADGFSALRDATAHYRGFYDLEKPAQKIRPMAELEDLFAELGPDGGSTDILVV